MADIAARDAPGKPIEIWFQDEARIGQKNKVTPWCNSTTMGLHLAEISQAVAPGAHAVLVLDQAGWHTSAKLKVPTNISLLPLPPKSPRFPQNRNRGGATGARSEIHREISNSLANAIRLQPEGLRQRRRGKAGGSWFVDETYIKVHGQ